MATALSSDSENGNKVGDYRKRRTWMEGTHESRAPSQLAPRPDDLDDLEEGGEAGENEGSKEIGSPGNAAGGDDSGNDVGDGGGGIGEEAGSGKEGHDDDEEEDYASAISRGDVGDSEAEDLAAGHGAKKYVCNDSERARIIYWMSEEGMGHISQEAPAFAKKARAVARRVRLFKPTAEDNRADLENFGCQRRTGRAKSATAASVKTIGRPLFKMKGSIKYGRVGDKQCAVMKRPAEKRRSSKALFALDCAVDEFYRSKRKRTSTSDASADTTKRKAKEDRLSAKDLQELKNKNYLDANKKQKEEKEAKAAERKKRQDEMLKQITKLADGQEKVAETSARLAATAEEIAAYQKELMKAQIYLLKKQM